MGVGGVFLAGLLQTDLGVLVVNLVDKKAASVLNNFKLEFQKAFLFRKRNTGQNLELQLVELGDTFVGALDSRGHGLLFR